MGKLNILHHKSYHVYNRENIERVRRDEQRAGLEAEAKNQSTIAANSEARLSLLRNQREQLKKECYKGKERRIEKALEDQLKGKKRKETDEDSKSNQRQSNHFSNNKLTDNSSIIDPKNGHINFWSSLENQSTSKVFGTKIGLEKNVDFMNDLKKKDEKWDEMITMRLDKPAHELHPWYTQNDLINGEDKKRSDRKVKEKTSKDESFKKSNDPLTFIKTSLYPSTSNQITISRKRKERQASPSASPVLKQAPTCRESDDEELDDMPALPSRINNIDKPSSLSKVNKPTMAPIKILKVDESAEKLKAQALLQRHQAPTPSHETTSSRYGYTDLYNREDVEAIQLESRHHRYSHSSKSDNVNPKPTRYWHSSETLNHKKKSRDWDSSIPENHERTRHRN